jgi:hypothetical protein
MSWSVGTGPEPIIMFFILGFLNFLANLNDSFQKFQAISKKLIIAN